MKKLSKLSIVLSIVVTVLLVFAFSGCKGPMGPAGPEGPGADDLYDVPPDCSGGSLQVNIQAIGWNLRGVDNFPSITAMVSIRDEYGHIPGIVPADLFNVVDEGGVAMWPIYVQEVEGVDFAPKADIVFVFDTTGSMAGQIATMKTKVSSFAATLDASGIDYRLGCVTYGDEMGDTVDPSYSKNRFYFAPSSSVAAFQSFINTLVAYGGWDAHENQIDALDYTRAAASESGSNPEGSFQNQASFSYRSDAKKIFILITDIGFHTPTGTLPGPGDVLDFYDNVYNTLNEEIAKLNADNVTVHVVSSGSSTDIFMRDEYQKLAADTGGLWFDITGNFSTIIDTIGDVITECYVVTYMTRDWTTGTTRDVRIAVHTALGAGQDIVPYTAPSSLDFSMADMMTLNPDFEPVVEPVTGLAPNFNN